MCEQVVNWLEGPGTEQLRTQWGIGDSIRASQALQQKHEEIESQHSVSTNIISSACVFLFFFLLQNIGSVKCKWGLFEEFLQKSVP